MEAPLDVVAAVVQKENDWGKLMVDHGGELLDTELPGD